MYAQWQFEKGEQTDRVHCQMVLQLNGPVKWEFLLATEPFKSWLGMQIKSVWDYKGAIAYVTKEDTRVAGPYKWGTEWMDDDPKPVKQGERTDIKKGCLIVKRAIEEGDEPHQAFKKLAQEMPDQLVKYHQGYYTYAEVIAGKDPYERCEEVVLYLGEPGAGKSHDARLLCDLPYTSMYQKNSNMYFDGYNNEEVLLFDEYAGQVSYQTWKNLCDLGAPNLIGKKPRFNLARSKAGSLGFGSRVICFVSNRLPTDWYPNALMKEAVKTISRRFTKIIWYGGDYKKGTQWKECFDTPDKVEMFFKWCHTQAGKKCEETYEDAHSQWGPPIEHHNFGVPFFD